MIAFLVTSNIKRLWLVCRAGAAICMLTCGIQTTASASTPWLPSEQRQILAGPPGTFVVAESYRSSSYILMVDRKGVACESVIDGKLAHGHDGLVHISTQGSVRSAQLTNVGGNCILQTRSASTDLIAARVIRDFKEPLVIRADRGSDLLSEASLTEWLTNGGRAFYPLDPLEGEPPWLALAAADLNFPTVFAKRVEKETQLLRMVSVSSCTLVCAQNVQLVPAHTEPFFTTEWFFTVPGPIVEQQVSMDDFGLVHAGMQPKGGILMRYAPFHEGLSVKQQSAHRLPTTGLRCSPTAIGRTVNGFLPVLVDCPEPRLIVIDEKRGRVHWSASLHLSDRVRCSALDSVSNCGIRTGWRPFVDWVLVQRSGLNGARAADLPLLVVLHGGPGDRTSLSDVQRFAADLDGQYDILAINYRGASGRGSDFQSVDAKLLRKDVARAVGQVVSDAQRSLDVDAAHTIMVGTSLGVYVAGLANARRPVARSLVSLSGLTSPAAALRDDPYSKVQGWSRIYQDLLTDPKSQEPLEDLAELHPAFRRALFLHGADDIIVRSEPVEATVSQLAAAGVNTSVVLLNGATHSGWDEPAREIALSAINNWLVDSSGLSSD
jgi:acetyl esterase/lipase